MAPSVKKLQSGWLGGLSRTMRHKRFQRFARMAESLQRPLRILDIGGRNAFWHDHGWTGRDDVSITLLNLETQPKLHSNIDPTIGDATDLSRFSDGQFDVVFSNSVIEHLFTYDKQMAMAREIRRVGKAYWVQTPNYWFPVEPHFRFIGWQWLPVGVRIGILRRKPCGWRDRCPEYQVAERIVKEVRLLSRRELRRLFPSSRCLAERWGGLVKSWIVVGGAWPAVA